MSNRYRLLEQGVFDQENNVAIPFRGEGWDEYMAALNRGDDIDPMLPPTIDLEAVRREMLAQVNVNRNNAMLDQPPITFNGVLYDADKQSRDNLMGLMTALSAGVSLPDGFTWRSYDNQDISIDATGLQGLMASMAGQVLLRQQNIYQHSWDLKAQLESVDDPRTVDIKAGWI